MPFLGEVFSSEIIKKPVLDLRGEELGRVKDLMVIKGDHLPIISALLVERKKKTYSLAWDDLNLFNKKIISTKLYADALNPYAPSADDLLILRDILDKQIVDANGAKVVRVNDIKLEGYNDNAVLFAVDVGIRGILRRLGIERTSEEFLGFFNTALPYNLISWNYIQPLRPELNAIALTIPRQMVADLHPADIASIISQVSREEGTHLIADLDVETAAEALSELKPEMQADIINLMDTEKAAELIEEMPPDDAADILNDLTMERAKEILEHVEKEEAEDIQELLSHEDDTAGGLMTNDYIAYSPEMTVAEATKRLREDAKEVETVYYIYVLDWNDKLMGVTSLREIILAEPECLLADIMKTNVKTIHPGAKEMEAAEIVSKYNLFALPVVDEEGFMHGIITVDDIIDVLLPPEHRRKRRRNL